jgi:excisionase family DNA binding protein
MINAPDWRDTLAEQAEHLGVTPAELVERGARALHAARLQARDLLADPVERTAAPAVTGAPSRPGVTPTGSQLGREQVRAVVRATLAELRPATATAGEYLTVAQASELAQVAPDTLRIWIKAGKLPRRMAGRELRVRREDLERLLASGPTSPTLTPEAAVARILARRRAV